MPERLLREPWRLALFFTAVFGGLILCTGVLVWQQTAGNLDTAKMLRGIRDLQVKSDRNNRTAWHAVDQARLSYEAGRKARGQLVAMVAEEHLMNKKLIAMERVQLRRDALALKNQRWMRAHIARLEKRRR